MTPQQEIARANQAKAIIESELYVEAYNAIREQYLAAWADSPVRDSEGREEIWRLLKSLEKVHAYFTDVITTGKLARLQIEETTEETAD